MGRLKTLLFSYYRHIHNLSQSFPLAFAIALCQYIVMVCIYCASPTSVINSRLQRRANHIWRRRKCLACDSVFTTEEHAQLAGSVMVQRLHGVLRPFIRDRLFVSIHDSCKHRASALEDAAALTETVINLLRPLITEGLLTRAQIVQTCHSVLERFDKTAATVYAAYHPLR